VPKVNTHPKNAFKILQLLLRCGMVCREELNVVLEMMPAIPDDGAVTVKEHSFTATGSIGVTTPTEHGDPGV
jgi:hypothetical protein